MKRHYYISILTLLLPLVGGSCSSDVEREQPRNTEVTSHVEVALDDMEIYATRANKNNFDGWSIATFSTGDVVGMYATTGRQNPEDLDDFSLPIWNEKMNYEGRTGNYYRFGNAEVVMDPTKVSTTSGYNYSSMYYPHFSEMPDPNIFLPSMLEKGLSLREIDPKDGIEKCQDLMITSSTRITLTEGVLRPSFKHYCFNLVLQRGYGFDEPKDPRIWVVSRQPFTDARITRYQYTNTAGEFQWTLQYIPEEGENPMGRILDELPGFDVNKYAVWQAWEGEQFKGVDSYYVLLPPKEVMFIMIQDNYGDWHNVTDFYIGSAGSKVGTSGTRYVVSISLEGLDVVVRPVFVEKWDEELTITDQRKVGINNFGDYSEWVTLYNSYTSNNRSASLIDDLRQYGDAKDDGDGVRWRFYINSDIDFANRADYTMIAKLEDVLEGSSTYTNYTISNVKGDLIDNMTATGELRALDFKKLYVIQKEGQDGEFGGLVNNMDDGLIENCNIINGVVVGNGPVGMLVGTINNGTIKDCNISGDAIGVKSYQNSQSNIVEGLFGTVNGYPLLENVNTTGLKFIINN
ncbi:MAG: hypothetical protein J1D77_03135 [Muribaculaceae bacterium]|nr:hypothetical protein [Muribaculaceae bacterium]